MNLIGFYSGAAPDNRGRMLTDIQSWSDNQLEAVHDYIQWLFPLTESSAFNANAPLLDEAAVAEFRARPELRENLRRSFLRMLTFYGFASGPQMEPAANFAIRAKNWLTPGDHNHLRITRILKSLRLLGLEQDAASFFDALSKVRESNRSAITDVTFNFWTEASGKKHSSGLHRR